MARGRMINITIAEDTEFNEMSVEAQLLYLRTIPHLDRDGLTNGHPTVLWGKVAPLMPTLLDVMPSAIDEWINADLVMRYKQAKTTIIFFKGFAKNQSLTHYDREAASTFAPPPGYHRTNKGLKPISGDDGLPPTQPETPKTDPPSNVGETPDQLRTNSGPTPDQLPTNGMEWNRKEVSSYARVTETEQQTLAAAAADLPETIPKAAEFMQEYERVWCLTLNPYHAEKVAEWSERVTPLAWSYALKECADVRKVGNWKYLETILRRVEVEGIEGIAPVSAPALASIVSINLAAV